MPARPSLTCRICQAPRKPGLRLALCARCYSDFERDKSRAARGTAPEKYRTPSPFPAGRCVVCGIAAETQGRCLPHYNEYQRERNRRIRLAWLAEHGERPKREKKQPRCKTEGCDGVPAKPYGKRCDECKSKRPVKVKPERVVKPKPVKVAKPKRERVVRLKVKPEPKPRRIATPKPKPAVMAKARKVKPVKVRPYYPPVDIVIGPEAFPKLQPVDIWGHKVTRLAPMHGWGR